MTRWKSFRPFEGRWMTELAQKLGYDPECVVSMRMNKDEFVVVHRDEQGRMQITEHSMSAPEGER